MQVHVTRELAQSNAIDPAAQRLLKASTDFLASRNRFSIDTRNSLEVGLYSGQKIGFNHTARQSVQRPNKLWAERTGDLVEQLFVYDGRSLTLFNPGDKAYATVDAPGTLEAMLDFARLSLDIVTPAGDLLYKNSCEILMDGVLSGFVVGKAVIEGVRCDHLAFRTPRSDWQTWIQEGAQPLPLLYLAGISPAAMPGLTLVREAHAIVGAPATPVSAAGVARRWRATRASISPEWPETSAARRSVL